VASRTGAGSGGRRLALQPEQAAHVGDQVGQPDLGRRPSKPDGPDEQTSRLLLGKTCSMCARTADFLALARALRSGIGRPGGFLRWMWLTSIRWLSRPSFLFER